MDIFGYGQDAAVAKYMTWRPLTTLAEAESLVNAAIDDWASGERCAYVLELNSAAGRVVGMLDVRYSTEHAIDVGYVLDRSSWGQGLMPEALVALAEEALTTRAVFRVQATCDVENSASISTLEKAGFVREGRLERYLVHPNISSDPRPCYMYARCR